MAGRWMPGTLTNQITKQFMEPRVLVVTDPRTDSQAIKEVGYASIPVIALCDTDSPLEYVDVAIPVNNKAASQLLEVQFKADGERSMMITDLWSKPWSYDSVTDLFSRACILPPSWCSTNEGTLKPGMQGRSPLIYIYWENTQKKMIV